MKKLTIIVIMFTVSGLMISCKKKDNIEINSAIVNFFSGDVKLLQNDMEAKIKVGDIISQGAAIITGEKSFAEIYIGPNAIKILPESKIEFKELIKNITKNSESTKLFVQNGRVFSKIVKKLRKGDNYEVSTPTSIAAVRGTNFLVSQENGKSNIACLNGKVNVRDTAKTEKDSVDINAGEEVYVEKDKPLNPTELSEENKENMKEILLGIKEMKQSLKDEFKKTKDKIDKSIKDQKDKNKENIKKVKEENKENISNIKNQVNEDKEKSLSAVKNFKKPDMKSVKPDFSKTKPGIK